MASSITSTFSSAATTSNFYPQVSTYSVTIPASGAIDSNFRSGVLSGTGTVFSGTIALTLSASGNTLIPGSIVMTLPSSVGNNVFNGYLRGSSFTPSLSVATFSLGFYGSDFISTNIGLSANRSSIVVDAASTNIIDIPFINLPGYDNDGTASNVSYFHTVADFQRTWNLNG